MAESVTTELNCRPNKIPKLQEDCQGSEPSPKQHRELRYGDEEDDEYLRQYMLYHYQFEKTQGFTIDWEQFDYVMYSRSLDQAPPIDSTLSNSELILESTLFAIDRHNEAQGTQLVFEEHIAANYTFANCIHFWLTFRARDMSSANPQSNIYQAKLSRLGKTHRMPIFRLKPSDEEIDSIQVKPPRPMYYEFDKPRIVFALAGPEDDAFPGVPFVFDRSGAGFHPDDLCDSD